MRGATEHIERMREVKRGGDPRGGDNPLPQVTRSTQKVTRVEKGGYVFTFKKTYVTSTEVESVQHTDTEGGWNGGGTLTTLSHR